MVYYLSSYHIKEGKVCKRKVSVKYQDRVKTLSARCQKVLLRVSGHSRHTPFWIFSTPSSHPFWSIHIYKDENRLHQFFSFDRPLGSTRLVTFRLCKTITCVKAGRSKTQKKMMKAVLMLKYQYQLLVMTTITLSININIKDTYLVLQRGDSKLQ